MGNKKPIRYEDIYFVYYAMPGAQGEEDIGYIVTQDEDGAVWHSFNTYHKDDWTAFIEAFPPLKEGGIDFLCEPSKPWQSLGLSSGHLLIGRDYYAHIYEHEYNKHMEAVRNLSYGDPYPRFDWIGLIDNLLDQSNKEHLQKEFFREISAEIDTLLDRVSAAKTAMYQVRKRAKADGWNPQITPKIPRQYGTPEEWEVIHWYLNQHKHPKTKEHMYLVTACTGARLYIPECCLLAFKKRNKELQQAIVEGWNPQTCPMEEKYGRSLYQEMKDLARKFRSL